MSKIDVLRFRDLTPALLARWEQLYASGIAPLDSPYYRPEYCAAIDAVRGDVEIGIVEQQGAVAALLPFHRTRGGIGKPAGLHLNDFQGFIGGNGLDVSLQDIVRGCGLKAYDFDHVPTTQLAFGSHTALVDASPYIDLSQGFAHYEQTTLCDHADYKSLLRRQRKLERDLGPLRVDVGSTDERVFDALIHWKRGQFAATKVPDVLAADWVLPVLRKFLECRSPSFAGSLNVLWAGDTIVGADLGLRSGDVYHSAWCAYEPSLKTYAPGRQAHLLLHKALAEQGVRRIEWGKGENAYKSRTMTGQSLVASGSVTCSPLQQVVRGGYWSLRKWARNSPVRDQIKAAADYLARLRRPAVPLAGGST